MKETQVPSIGLEDYLEKEMATNSSILAWEIPCTEESWGCKSWTQLLTKPPPPYMNIYIHIYKIQY